MTMGSIFGENRNKKRKIEAQKGQKGAQTPTPRATVSVFGKIIAFFKLDETVSVLLFLVFLIIALSSLFIAPQMQQWRIREGDVALKDIYAPYDFTYYWGVNEDRTGEARRAAYDAVLPLVRRNADTERKIESSLESFFAVIAEEKKSEIPVDEKVESLKEKTKISLPDKKIRVLLEFEDTEDLKKKTIDIAGKVFLIGFISEEE